MGKRKRGNVSSDNAKEEDSNARVSVTATANSEDNAEKKEKKQPKKARSRTIFVVGRGTPKKKHVKFITTKESVLKHCNFATTPIPPPNPSYFPRDPSSTACRSSIFALTQVQKCILRHDWDAALKLIKLVLKLPVYKMHIPCLLQSLTVILQMHPSSSKEQYLEYMRSSKQLWKNTITRKKLRVL